VPFDENFSDSFSDPFGHAGIIQPETGVTLFEMVRKRITEE
jgi:hypothetical protein